MTAPGHAEEPRGQGATACRMLVIGVGGGGSNAVSRMSAGWRDGPDVVAVNTDAQALGACSVPYKVQIGKNLTQGLGAGGDAAIGKLAAEDDLDTLRELVSHLDVVFVVTTLGGGTGTGAAPVLAKVAREEGALTLCFATLPFDFEGERRKKQAEEGLRALRLSADVVICVPNKLLLEFNAGQASLAEAFGKVDAMLGVGMRSLWKLLAQAGIINLDFADLRQLVEHSGGSCSFAYAEGTGLDKASSVVNSLLRSPLLNRGDVLTQAEAILVSIVGGHDLTLVDVQKIMAHLTTLTRPGVRVFMGASVDPEWQNRLALTVLAAESWQEGKVPDASPGRLEAPAATATEPGVGPGKTLAGVKASVPIRAIQESLKFETDDKGKFKNTEPTLYEGEDLDIPTYVRRGIKLSFER